MKSWLSGRASSGAGPSGQSNAGAARIPAVVRSDEYVTEEPNGWLLSRPSKSTKPRTPDITAEPVFDQDPPLYLLFPKARLLGSQAPKTTLISGKFQTRVNKKQHVLSVVAKLVPCYLFKNGKTFDSGSLAPLVCTVVETPRELEVDEYVLPFAFEVPCSFWGRSTFVEPEGAPEEPLFSLWYKFEIHFTRLVAADQPSTCPSATSSEQLEALNPSSSAGHLPSPKRSQAKTVVDHELAVHRSSSTQSPFQSSDNSASLVSLSSQHPQLYIVSFPTRQNLEAMSGKAQMWRSYYHRRFFAMVSSPADPGELPPPLERAIEEFAPQTGPINLLVTSRSLTVGAMLNFNLNLPAMPKNCKLREIRGYTHSISSWKSPKPPSSGASIIYHETPYRLPFFTIPQAEITIEAGPAGSDVVQVSAAKAARLPNDTQIGPSTLPGVNTPMRTENSLHFEFEVLDHDGTKKIITIKEPVILASCMLISELVNLPSYGSQPIPRNEFQPVRPAEKYACVCGFTFDQLMQRENEGILPAVEYQVEDLKRQEEAARNGQTTVSTP